MNEIIKKVGKELLRAALAALLAALGLEATGCVACGTGASASCVSSCVPFNK